VFQMSKRPGDRQLNQKQQTTCVSYAGHDQGFETPAEQCANNNSRVMFATQGLWEPASPQPGRTYLTADTKSCTSIRLQAATKYGLHWQQAPVTKINLQRRGKARLQPMCGAVLTAVCLESPPDYRG
jgi:hypothetical protein